MLTGLNLGICQVGNCGSYDTVWKKAILFIGIGISIGIAVHRMLAESLTNLGGILSKPVIIR